MNDHQIFDFSEFPVLATERLTLRRCLLSDAKDILVFRGDPMVQRYNGPVFETEDEVQALIGEIHDEFDRETGIGWAVALRDTDRVVGLFGYHDWNRFHRRAQIGYDLARAYWGQRVATEALRAMLDFGFERMDLNRVGAHTIADNYESVRLLERIGFRREGTRRSFSWEDDCTFHPGAIYGLLREEWITG